MTMCCLLDQFGQGLKLSEFSVGGLIKTENLLFILIIISMLKEHFSVRLGPRYEGDVMQKCDSQWILPR